MPSFWRYVPLLAAAVALPAEAGECLRGVDNMVVVYALPPSPQFMSPQAPNARQSGSNARLAEYETRYQERPVTPHAQPRPADVGEPAQAPLPLPELSASVPPLSETQRRNLQEVLYAARDAEADGDEVKCDELLKKAKDIAAAPPAATRAQRTPKAPQR
jgi:hypothetical protein